MKKQYLIFPILLLVIFSVAPLQAQDIGMNEQELKSVSKAQSIALTNTLLSIGTGVGAVALFENNTVQKLGAILGVYGIIAAPSTGNFYANDYPRGFAGMGARAIGTFLMADATSEILGNQYADVLGVDDQSVKITDTKILIGGAIILGSMAYNILSTQQSVDEFNEGGERFAVNVGSTTVGDQIAPVLSANISF